MVLVTVVNLGRAAARKGPSFSSLSTSSLSEGEILRRFASSTASTTSLRSFSSLSLETSRSFPSGIIMPDHHHIPDENVVDIEELLHQAALEQGQKSYIDPKTGFTVFTELFHLKRGTCCGNKCRHCPFGYENVKTNNKRTTAPSLPAPKLKSGDRSTAQAMVETILSQASSTQNVVNGSHNTKGANAGTSSSKIPPSGCTKNVPYTRGGDGGTSQLGTGERRSKDDCNFEALGNVDELCTFVGVVHAQLLDTLQQQRSQDDKFGALPEQLLDIMSRLFDIGSHVAKPRDPGTDFTANGIGDGFDLQHVEDLESWINDMTEALPELTSFILPTGAPAAAQLHVARTVCRRAERRMVPIVIEEQTCDPNAMKYLNRLSDYFFVAARWVNYCEGQPEIQYQRDTPQTTQRQRVSRSLKHED